MLIYVCKISNKNYKLAISTIVIVLVLSMVGQAFICQII